MKFNFFSKKNSYTIKPTLLIVLDGFGIAPPSEGNAISKAKTPNIDKYIKSYPNTSLIASGESVGLPANEVGNTEVGHLTLGAGRVILQDIKRIAKSIDEKTFQKNNAFLSAIEHSKKHNSNLHLIGLLGSGNVHSSLTHLHALLDTVSENRMQNVFLHLFTDGRDSHPKEGLELVIQIENKLKSINIGQIATISGRYYAMDRDTRWERTELAYAAMTMGVGHQSVSASEAVKQSYINGKTDEFIEPVVIFKNNAPVSTINDNDAAIFFNFRIDRPRQLTMALVMPDFESPKSFKISQQSEVNLKHEEKEIKETFKRQKIVNNLYFVTMTEYQKELPVQAIAFPTENVSNSLTEVIASNKLSQLHVSESEKQRFVTYYFRGQKEDPFSGEETLIINSPKVSTYDKTPEMSAYKIADEVKSKLKEDKYNFILINFANPDMLAHTGNIQATIKSLEDVDKASKTIVDEALIRNGTVLITADHGNAEEMLTFPNQSFFYTSSEGKISTDHSNNPVPLAIVNNAYKSRPTGLNKGSLADVAPTILAIMGIQKPTEMTGNSLII